MRKLVIALALHTSLWMISVPSAGAEKRTDREQEGLVGLVKSVLIDTAQLSNRSGKWVEGPHVPWLSMVYDRMGNKIEENQLYNDKTLNFKSVYTYDSQGNLKEGAEYDFNLILTFKWIYTHDPEKKITEETRTEPDGTLFSKSIYTYGARGNLIEESRSHVHSANDFKWVYIYDADGKKREEKFYVVRSQGLLPQSESALDFRSVYTYDAKGNLAEETRYDAAGKIRFKKDYTYQFDAAGNWITQTARISGAQAGPSPLEPSEVTYRTLTYYAP